MDPFSAADELFACVCGSSGDSRESK